MTTQSSEKAATRSGKQFFVAVAGQRRSPIYRRAMEPFWKRYSIGEGETRYWGLGPLEIWARRLPGEWQIAHRTAKGESLDSRWSLAEVADKPPEVEWLRYIFDSPMPDPRLVLRAEMPDRAIVSRPEEKLELPGGATARFVCGIPLWIRIEVGSEESSELYHLTTLPARILSKTWFGSPRIGEPAYAAPTRAVRVYRDLAAYGFRALCPVVVCNETRETLSVTRICLRVKNLGLFQGENYLWTNQVRATRQTLTKASRVRYDDGPGIVEDVVPVFPAREKPSPEGSLLRTFTNLRHFIADYD